MPVSYKKLFHMLIEKEISTSGLQQKANISANIIAKFKKNEYVALENLEKVCNVLQCDLDDILDFTPVKEDEVQ